MRFWHDLEYIYRATNLLQQSPCLDPEVKTPKIWGWARSMGDADKTDYISITLCVIYVPCTFGSPESVSIGSVNSADLQILKSVHGHYQRIILSICRFNSIISNNNEISWIDVMKADFCIFGRWVPPATTSSQRLHATADQIDCFTNGRPSLPCFVGAEVIPYYHSAKRKSFLLFILHEEGMIL